jgi:hypothetical protein
VNPLTADERERRVMQYLGTLNKPQLAEFRLGRMNRISNFRKALRQLLDELIEARAEELSASWLEQFAPPRPKRADVTVGRLPLVKKRRIPVWVKRIAESARYR